MGEEGRRAGGRRPSVRLRPHPPVCPLVAVEQTHKGIVHLVITQYGDTAGGTRVANLQWEGAGSTALQLLQASVAEVLKAANILEPYGEEIQSNNICETSKVVNE